MVEDSERVEKQERENRLTQLKSGLQKKKEHLTQIQQNMAMFEQSRDAVNSMVATLQDIQLEHDKERLVS